MPFAQLLIAITGGGSLLLLAALGGVVVRRGVQEKRTRLEEARAAGFRKAVLPLIAQPDIDASAAALGPWRRDPMALQVAEYLLQLLRGAERQRLLQLVHALDLLDLDRELARLRSRNPAIRIASVRKLGSLPEPRVEDALKLCMRTDRDPEIRLEAGLALIRLGTSPTVAEAIDALNDGAYRAPAHRIIFRALAVQRPSEMVAAWATHRVEPARLAIIDALGDVFDPRAFVAVRFAILDADPQMRCEGLRAARRIGHPSMAPAVLAALDDPEWIVRVQAASTAGTMRLVEARARLHELRSDARWWVRYRAAEALDALGLAAVTESAAA